MGPQTVLKKAYRWRPMNAGQVVANRIVSEKGKTKYHRRDLHTEGTRLGTDHSETPISKHKEIL